MPHSCENRPAEAIILRNYLKTLFSFAFCIQISIEHSLKTPHSFAGVLRCTRTSGGTALPRRSGPAARTARGTPPD
jgi:hypothetical protein